MPVASMNQTKNPPRPHSSSHFFFSSISSDILLSAGKNSTLKKLHRSFLPLLHKFMASNGVSTTSHQMLSYPSRQIPAESYNFIGYEDDQDNNPPSIPKDCYPSFSSFPLSPSTFDHDLLITAHLTTTNTLEAPTLSPPVDMDTTTNVPPTTRSSSRRKRPFRTDRHSKIFTAQGLRDRRMRLSQEVASKFFCLQDMLGFDKASQTVDWLLIQSKSAIQQLIDASQLENQSISLSSLVVESSTSECFSAISNDKQKSTAASPKAKDHIGLPPFSIATSDPILTKETRDKARARARERTREKKRIPSGRPEGSCKEDQPSFKTDAVKKGVVCIDGVCQPSPMTVVPSKSMCNKNNNISLLDEQMNIN